jgi:hypothetical protein
MMANIFSVDPEGMEAFAATQHAAGEIVTTASSADSAAMLSAAAEALGPIGAAYLAAYAPAQSNTLAAAMLVGQLHHAIGGATQAAKAIHVASDHD